MISTLFCFDGGRTSFDVFQQFQRPMRPHRNKARFDFVNEFSTPPAPFFARPKK